MSDDSTTTDHMNYNEIVERALKQVVRESLERTAGAGLPGEHHFYISFLTEHPGVVLPDHLRTRYPEEITIVLQHEFWDLEVGDEGFSITLSFNNTREFIGVPWVAITGFADPSVQFGLQFKAQEEGESGPDAANLAREMAEEVASTEQSDDTADSKSSQGSADVVQLDQFRNK